MSTPLPNTLARLQARLRKQTWWLTIQEARREGLRNVARRIPIQMSILRTPPVYTASSGRIEVRVLTWRRDWMNLIWMLKSFYHFAGVDYPLYIHDGGLLPRHARVLQRHFPNARIVSRPEADAAVERLLTERGLHRSLAYRRRNVATCKVFDFHLMSRAERILMIDSDIVFFRQPEELIFDSAHLPRDFYNRDCAYGYSLSMEELEQEIGLRPIEFVNSGLALVRRSSVEFERIEQLLENSKLFGNTWVTEQTLLALCSTVHGVELLPDCYHVSTEPGFPSNVACKHYPGFFRPLLYQEGMRRLADSGLLKQLRRTKRKRMASEARAPIALDDKPLMRNPDTE